MSSFSNCNELNILNKNDIVEIEITGVTNEGNGVGRYENIAVFVPFTAVGDVIKCKIVKVKKTYAYGIIDEILKPSESRCEAKCQVFKKCGGCAFCHFDYDEELRIKQDFVQASFERIGKLQVDWEEILGCEQTEGYRNKAMYPVGEIDGKIVCGFYSRRSHRVVSYLDCDLQPEIFKKILKEILEWCNDKKISAYDEISHKGLLRHIYLRKGEHSGEIMVCLVVTDFNGAAFDGLAQALGKKFSQVKSVVLNLNKKNTNVILGDKCKTVFGQDYITDTMCGRTFRISPLSFYQVNTVQAERLYEIAKDYAQLKEGETLLDLYCGVGTIGLSVADEKNKLVGVEIIPQAIENAKINAKLNGAENAEYICGDAGEIAKTLLERGEAPDVIIADPARKGCDSLSIESMVKMSPKRIVMISCNHATAARDCALLCEKGYKIEKGRAVDLFPRTTHIETVVLLSKLKSTHHIEVELKTDELDLTSAESKATYDEIKAYVKKHTGLTVSSLNIAQVKQKCGIIERENYNKAKSKDSRQPKCPKEKEEAIVEALKCFKMV